ncbi:uncharacterized protein [Enoplosus armatus]|uniref:uncharacterized protein n=1 Tax=Enoplosus armatus TaxID=215367 RepID=UPI00399678F2
MAEEVLGFWYVGRCTDDLIFVTKTVGVGDDGTLSCTRQTSDHSAKLFWIRLVSGNLPEFLGGTYSFNYSGVNETPRITSKQEPGSFVLHINNTKLSDIGVYYCIKVDKLKMTFLKGTFLSIKGPEPDITAVIHVPPSDPVRPGDSVTLQCSVLSHSENKTCPGDHSVSWFRAGSDGSHPSVIFAHGNSGDECEKSPDARSPQKCVYSFSKKVSSSDAGTYYCAVAACGEILFGHGTKPDIEGLNMWERTVLILLCAALAISLIVIAFLISSIKAWDCCNGCTDDLIFVTKTVGVGDDVTLSCTRQTSWLSAQLFWIRLVSGNLPEFLGGTFTFDYDGVNKTPRITSKQEPGSFVLHINNTKLSDTGVYYCIKVDELKMTFLKGTFLSIKGPEPDITAVIHVPPSDPVRPGDSVTLQCSVLSHSENKTCPGDHSVSWFRAGSDGSHPSVMFAHANSGDECEKSPDARSPQTCVYSFSKNVSSSDAGTYYCAVAACGEILFGHGTKQDIEGLNMWESTVLFLLCAALAISLIVIAFLIYTIKKKTCGCCNAAVALQTNAATAGGDQQSQQRDHDTSVYSAVVFTVMKTSSGGARGAKAAERERIYAAVKAFWLD